MTPQEKKQQRLESFKNSYIEFVKNLSSFETEQQALDALTQIQNQYHIISFQSPSLKELSLLDINCMDSYESAGITICEPVNPLYFSLVKKWQTLASHLFQLGLGQKLGESKKVFIKTEKEDKHKEDFTLFMFASYLGLEQFTKTLTDCGRVSLSFSRDGKTAKDFTSSTTIKALLDGANNEYEGRNRLIFFVDACQRNQIAEAEKIFMKAASKKVSVSLMKDFLMIARNSYFSTPSKTKEFDALCDKIKKEIASRSLEETVQNLKEQVPPDMSMAYRMLYNEPYVEDEIATKEDFIKNVIAEIFVRLRHRDECLEDLRALNQDFCDYFKDTHGKAFPQLNPQSYIFKKMSDEYVPYPVTDEHIDKKQALPEFLILLLNLYGIAFEAYKWIGGVPFEIANNMVKNVNFFVESHFGGGWLHNKFIHMVQWGMIASMIRRGVIKLERCINGEQIKLEEKEIFEQLVTLKLPDENLVLWSRVLDAQKRGTFSDPINSAAFIEQFGAELGFRAISDYLKDAHLQGLKVFFNAYKQIPEYSDLDLDTFFEKLNDLDPYRFLIPHHLFQFAIEHEVKKGREIVQRSAPKAADEFAIVRKHYKPNTKFKFHDHSKNSNDNTEEKPLNQTLQEQVLSAKT